MRTAILTVLMIAVAAGIIAAAHHRRKSETWTKEPQQFLGIAMGKPISESLPLCKVPDDRERCFSEGYSTAENVTDAFGVVGLTLERGLVQKITMTLSSENADLAYHDLVERFGRPNSGDSDAALWKGKHISISYRRPAGDDDVGFVVVNDSDVTDDPTPKHTNTF